MKDIPARNNETRSKRVMAAMASKDNKNPFFIFLYLNPVKINIKVKGEDYGC